MIVKVPRWNFDKFEGSDRRLGVQMKSVGRPWASAAASRRRCRRPARAWRSAATAWAPTAARSPTRTCCSRALSNPSWNRLFHIYDAIKAGIPFKTIHERTGIDLWFLRSRSRTGPHREGDPAAGTRSRRCPRTCSSRPNRRATPTGDRAPAALPGERGGSAPRGAQTAGCTNRWTPAPASSPRTPYYYSTFEEENESERSDKKKIIVLGSGPNRIGQGIEFDYCCVHGVLAAKEEGYETITINCNPETVSTDFDTADKLYFEPVFWEHIYDIIQH